MQRRALRFELDLNNLFRVIPGAARVGHEDGLEQSEQRNRHQVADEEERFVEGERQRRKEHGQKDVEHAALGILGADFNHLLAVVN